MKTCLSCGLSKEFEEFHRNKRQADGYDTRCKECKAAAYRERRDRNPFSTYITAKKSQCRRLGIPFDLTTDYLTEIWTGTCPVFGTPLSLGSDGHGSSSSAHLDRFNPSIGYVRGNVCWISGRANRIKYDASLDELKLLVKWMESVRE